MEKAASAVRLAHWPPPRLALRLGHDGSSPSRLVTAANKVALRGRGLRSRPHVRISGGSPRPGGTSIRAA